MSKYASSTAQDVSIYVLKSLEHWIRTDTLLNSPSWSAAFAVPHAHAAKKAADNEDSRMMAIAPQLLKSCH